MAGHGPAGPARPPGSTRGLPILPDVPGRMRDEVEYLVRSEPTKDRKVPDLKTSRTTAAWLVDSKFPAALGICDTRVPPTSQIRVRLDFMAVGPYEQEGPWMGVALDIPPGPPTEAAPASYRGPNDGEVDIDLEYHTVNVKFDASCDITATRLSRPHVDFLAANGIIADNIDDVLQITSKAGPNSKAAVKGFSWPLARTGDNGNYLKRHQDPNCRPFVFSNNLGQVLKIPLEKMLSEDVTLLVPSGLAFGRLDKMSRVFQWFGQIVPYRPFAESDITKWDRKALAARPGVYKPTAVFSSFEAWSTQAAGGIINQVHYMLGFADHQREIRLNGYFVQPRSSDDTYYLLGVHLARPSASIVAATEIWANIQAQLMSPGEEVRVYFKPGGKAKLPSRQRNDEFFWKAMVVEVPESWKAATDGHLNLALKVHRPPVINDERARGVDRFGGGGMTPVYLGFLPGEEVARRELAGIQRIQPFEEKKAVPRGDDTGEDEDVSDIDSDDYDEDEAVIYDPITAARIQLAQDSLDNQLQRDLFQGAGFTRSAFLHDWASGMRSNQTGARLLSLLHPDYHQIVHNYFRRVPMGFATISGPAGCTKSSVLVIVGLIKVAAGEIVSAAAPSNMAATNLANKACTFLQKIRWTSPLLVRAYPVQLEMQAVLSMFAPRAGPAPSPHDLLCDGFYDELSCSPDSRGVWNFDNSCAHRVLSVIANHSSRVGNIDLSGLRSNNAKLGGILNELRETVIDDLVRFLSAWNTGSLPTNYHGARSLGLDRREAQIRQIMSAVVSKTDLMASTVYTLRDPFYRQHNDMANAYLLDEASMLRQSQAKSVMRLSRPTAAAGDTKQLGLVNLLTHTVNASGQNLDPLGDQYSHLDKLIRSDMVTLFLKIQVRAPPGTNDLVHDVFYPGLKIQYASGNTIDGSDHKFTKPSESFFTQFPGVQKSPQGRVWPVFVQCTTPNETKVVQHSSMSKSNASMRSVMLKVLDEYIRQYRNNGFDIQPKNILIVVAYSAELQTVQDALDKWEHHLRRPAPGAALDAPRELIPLNERARVATAGSFQGGDREVVFFLSTSDASSELGFVGEPERLCTASSRHRDFFVCVGNIGAIKSTKKTYQGGKEHPVDRYYRWFVDHGRVINASRFT